MTTPAALRAAYASLAGRRDDGVPGTMVQESGVPGPTVGITLMTHGNEPAGLAAWHTLTALRPLHLLRGRLVWVLNNLAAAAAYFALPDDAALFTKQQTRLCDVNMNRLPRNLHAADPAGGYEIRRGQELLPVWASFAFGMDIHTTSQAAPPIIGPENGLDPALYRGFPIVDVIEGFGEVMRDRQACGFYGTPPGAAPTLSMESGAHEDPRSGAVAVDYIERFLANLDMIAPIAPAHVEHRVYRLTHGLFFPNLSYEMVEVFPNFAPIRAGQLLATGDGPPLTSPSDGHVLMCPASRRLTNIGEEAVFISAPVRVLTPGR